MVDRMVVSRLMAACAVPVLLTAGCGRGETASDGSIPNGEVQAVTTTFERFFDSSIAVDQKAALLENGQAFTETLERQANSSIAGGATASVSQVDGAGPARATVTFTIKKHGIPLLVNRHGIALQIDGSWKVAAQTFCDLLRVQGSPPAVCDAGPTTTPSPTS
ncbi:hypothetical protein [Nocardia aurantiaca]|uniref:Low molecular weight antigen MTB12-like C-terminal domain-containing protein n=1 Tax=Nocardia aurantiaca TaxID=2675850 RepID=A0A6I3L0W4_9NOCA|nr:hypothetical protein [Nocardia aurantiaca]MTE13499.1 hypothetical protein [Nocardia aurantiaca]